jgi:hypothetical protein
MPRISNEQADEFDQLKREQTALNTLMARMAAYEAAIRILIRHDLMAELATEMREIPHGPQ